ncbi:MAG: hypothetical protein WBP93_07830 [Pyrinomonadaceae bacterium]
MSTIDDLQPDNGKILFDREDLASDIEWILRGDARSPEILAQLFVRFGQAMDGGLEGINQTRKALGTVTELIYLHSRAHGAALRLYGLLLEGQLKVEDEPVNLINGAIERGTAGAREVKAAGGARKGA